MPISVRQQLALGCLVLLLAAIFVGGAQPGAGSLFPPPWDKAVHLLVFGMIGALLALGLPRLSLALVLLSVCTIGAADEFHQYFLPGRHAGIDDWLADLAGGIFALLIIPYLRRRYAGVRQ